MSRKNTDSMPAVPATEGRTKGGVDRGQDAEEGQRSRVHAAVRQLGEHEKDHDRNQRREDDRCVLGMSPAGRNGDQQRPDEQYEAR